jgi:hypothetical protein
MKQQPQNKNFSSFEDFRDYCLRIKAGYPSGHAQREAIDKQIEEEIKKNK